MRALGEEMKKINSQVYAKKYFIIGLLLITGAISYYLTPTMFLGLGDKIDRLADPEKYERKEFVLVTDNNQKFIVVEKLVRNFPDKFYDYEIYQAYGPERKFVIRLELVKKMEKEDLLNYVLVK